jgi:sorting nexin-8
VLIVVTGLPVPKLPSLSTPTIAHSPVQQVAKPTQQPRNESRTEPVKPRSIPKPPLVDPETDPWGSPALHKGHNHDVLPKTNGAPRPEVNGFHEPVRTTSTFTTSAEGSTGNQNKPNQDSTTPADSIWGSYGAGSSGAFNNQISSGLGAGGFDGNSGGNDQGRPVPPTQARAIGGGQVNRGVEETIQVQLLPEKEGMFLFQHHNYHVISVRRGSKVVRRYSDFVWLLDCLHKRFPFRQLPLLPPKRVGGT